MPSPGSFAKLPHSVLRRRDLTPAAKLVYAVLVDRMGENGECWPGVRRLALDCGLGQGTVVAGVKQLVHAGLIQTTPAKGGTSTTRYTLSKRSQSERSDSERSESERSESERSDSERCARIPNTTRSDSERNQTKQSDPITRPSKKARAPFDLNGVDIESIYEAYPRHVGWRAAFRAIQAALQRIAGRDGVTDPVGWLLDRVRVFAASPAGQAGKYTPHPSTWFNQERYDDDPAEWRRTDRTGSRGPGAAADRRAERGAREYPEELRL